jgi:hypothetical protein
VLDDLDGPGPVGVDVQLEELYLARGSGVDHLVERARCEGWDLSRSVSGDVTASTTDMTMATMTTTTTGTTMITTTTARTTMTLNTTTS